MRKGIVLCACCAVVGLLASAALADAGRPSDSKMRQMGLYGTTVVSDSVAMDVRGFGYQGGKRSRSSVKVWGESEVELTVWDHGTKIEAEAEHGYYAEGKEFAIGADLSVAGYATASKHRRRPGDQVPPIESVNSNNSNGGSHLQLQAVVFAGGFSAAYAK